MKIYDGGMTILLICLGALALGYASTKVFKMQDDNVVEEMAEQLLEDKLGLDIDLSPESAE